jgi:hypothetical protein
MALGWKVLLPLALVNVMVTAAALLGDQLLLSVVLGVVGVAALVIIGGAVVRSRRPAPAAGKVRA